MTSARSTLFSAMAVVGLFTTLLAAGPAAATPLGQTASSCEVKAGKLAFPDVMLLGETTSVTLTFSAVCAGETSPLHLVLVVDASGSMMGDPSQRIRSAVKTIVKGLDLPDNPSTKVGIVEFNDTARTLCRLMNDEGKLMGCAGQVSAHGGTAIDRGIVEGLKVVAAGRVGLGEGVTPNEVMVVVSDGANNTGCDPVKSAARRAKGQGVLVITVCVGGGCDAQCMREAASSARYFFQVDDASQLVPIFDRIRTDLTAQALRRLTVVDTIPANMDLVAGTVDPPASLSPDRKTLTWDYQGAPSLGVTLTFQLRPREAGSHPTNLAAVADFVDQENRAGSVAFPVPSVTVFRAVRVP
jgi:uncharacterized protein YegL